MTPISTYLSDLRASIGHGLLLLPSVTALIFDDRRRILLLRHSEGGVWVAPGGSVEPHERPADALVREVWEETGLDVEPVRVAGVYGGPEFEVRYRNGDRVSYFTVAFECRVLGGTARADGVETLEAGYFSREEALELPLPDWARVVLPDAFATNDRARYQPPLHRPGRR